MAEPATILVTVLVAYLIGAIPFGYLVAKARGVDITTLGSGNIGATNVGRVLGKRFGILVFVLDFAKGALPTAGARAIAGSGDDLLPVLAGLATVLGHMFPVYLRFRGGKGVATGAGVVAVLLPIETGVAVVVWITALCAFRYVSLASLLAAATLCLVRLFIASEPFVPSHLPLPLFALVAAALVFIRHHSNIRRLWHGTEPRIGDSPAMLRFTKTLHVLSMGLWFGTLVFFTFVVGLTLLGTFDQLTASTTDRPVWLPAPAWADKAPPSDRFPTPLSKEQGRRIFGVAVGSLFFWYFGIQTVCAVLALATAWPWSKTQESKVHRVRVWILAVALLTLGINWWLDREVNSRRAIRSETSDAVLRVLATEPKAPDSLVQEADAARANFDRWHSYSLMANFATLLLATIAMALTASLPNEPVSIKSEESPAPTP